MSSDTTRREFMEGAATLPLVLGGDDGLLESLLPEWLSDEDVASTDYQFIIGTEAQRQEINAAENLIFYELPSAKVFDAVEDEDAPVSGQYDWTKVASTGSDPTFDAATIEGATEVRGTVRDGTDTTVYDSETSTVGDGTTTADHQAVNTDRAEIGEDIASDKHNFPEFTPNTGTSEGRPELNFKYFGNNIRFEELTSKSYEIQGLAYKDGYVYVSEVTDDGTPSVIHKLNTDGSETGETYSVPHSASDHVSALAWSGGYLWACAFNNGKIYKIDFEAKSAVGSFDTPNQQGPTAIAFLPVSTGGEKLLVSEWQLDTAYLVNQEDALSDGTLSGNEFRTLDNGIETTIQGLKYRNGTLYVNLDNDRTLKRAIPFADEIGDGMPLLWDSNEWVTAQGVATNECQDLAYNPKTNNWFTADISNTLYTGVEGVSQNIPVNYQSLSVVDGGVEDYKVLAADYAARHDHPIMAETTPAWVECWFYDNPKSSGQEVYALASNLDVSNRVVIGVNTTETNGATNYYQWTPTNGWRDMGIARPDNAQWVKWGWHFTGSVCIPYISTDGGRSWQQGNVEASDAVTFARFGPDISSTDSSLKYGGITIKPIR